jgi:glycogen debranching enzyme
MGCFATGSEQGKCLLEQSGWQSFSEFTDGVHQQRKCTPWIRGTVWAVEQSTIVFGLRRFGFDARALELAQALFDLSLLCPEYRIPECVGGYARGESRLPGAYPRANTPQLWNATAFPLVVQTILGLLPIASMHTLMIDPVVASVDAGARHA